MDGVLREVLRQALRPHGTHRAAGTSQEVPDAEPPWSPEQWNEAFSYLFLAAPGSRHAVLEHQDDMLWFVTAAGALATGTAPVTLRRNVSASLPPELRPGGRDFGTVDWAASVQLNLVVQATYVLTVVQCEEMALAAVAQAGNTTPGTYSAHLHERAAGRATPSGDSAHTSTSASTGSSIPGTVVAQRRVFASPMSADVNLEDAKAGRPPAACYPDVSFSVDNFESGFEDMVGGVPGWGSTWGPAVTA
ncbi:hypothetical protein HYH02_004935 [Chlamydomonas schloesseri]|uniref:Uncharacterized protein n=1 Tax=Chlamydomonas schloesseri TaxID=2026947 RepID=A0A835WMB9_9CHLO|nr:hypothetical protein HYH02_004935 [Chlamydomonas schloesseri]|eukprot:KAG2450433.1 hypothetical protein HYH02_004935 [Chlamydomonas schloesseri]